VGIATTFDVAVLSGDGGLEFVTSSKDLFKVGLLASGIQVCGAMTKKFGC
jgi:hypothetical protein